MADGSKQAKQTGPEAWGDAMSGSYIERNAQGGLELTADGWDEMARLMEQATECTKRCAEALRKEGRHSANFREAKRAWARVVAQQMNLIGAASGSGMN